METQSLRQRPRLSVSLVLFLATLFWLISDRVGHNPLKQVVSFPFWREAAELLDVIIGVFVLLFWLIEKPKKN